MSDSKPNTLATPEGDNEQPPDVPLTPNQPTPERPPGNQPHTELPLQDALEPIFVKSPLPRIRTNETA